MMTKCLCGFVVATALLTQWAVAKSVPAKVITISLQAPATNYKIKITEIKQVGTEVWVLAQITSKGIGGQAITTIADSVNAMTTAKIVKLFAIGKSWNWANKAKIKFVKTAADLGAGWKKGTKISFSR
jgi:hypothetical protein